MTKEQEELVEFASRISKQMGAQMKTLFMFDLVGIAKEHEFKSLVEHLKTNKRFQLMSGFNYNFDNGFIWLNSLGFHLKNQLKKKRKG